MCWRSISNQMGDNKKAKAMNENWQIQWKDGFPICKDISYFLLLRNFGGFGIKQGTRQDRNKLFYRFVESETLSRLIMQMEKHGVIAVISREFKYPFSGEITLTKKEK